jgi:hypothetical protein
MAFMSLAVISGLMDYAITLLGFMRFSWLLEANPFIRALILNFKLNPYLACTMVFAITLIFILSAYKSLGAWLNTTPYSESLRDVRKYLWNLSSIHSRDLAIFACLALNVYFTVQHLTGFLSWLRFLTGIPIPLPP